MLGCSFGMWIRTLEENLGLRHHGGSVLRPVAWHRPPHLDERRDVGLVERRYGAVGDDLLRLHLVGDVTLEVGPSFEEARSRETVGSPSDQREQDRSAVNADIGLINKPVDDVQKPVNIDGATHLLSQELVPQIPGVRLRHVGRRGGGAGVLEDGVQPTRLGVGSDVGGTLHVVLDGVGEIVAVAEVKVGRHVDGLKHLDVSLLVWMGFSVIFVRDRYLKKERSTYMDIHFLVGSFISP